MHCSETSHDPESHGSDQQAELGPQQTNGTAAAMGFGDLPIIALAIGHGTTIAHLPPSIFLTSLPVRQPEPGPVWIRMDGNLEVSITPGFSIDISPAQSGSRAQGDCGPDAFPSGTIPRLLLISLLTEAIESASRFVELDSRMQSMLLRIGGMQSSGGAYGSATRFRDQARRLFASELKFRRRGQDQWTSVLTHTNAAMLRSSNFGALCPKKKNDALAGIVELSEEFFELCRSIGIQGSLTSIEKLKQSSVALDVYAWVKELATRDWRCAAMRGVVTVPKFGLISTSDKKRAEYLWHALDQVSEVAPEMLDAVAALRARRLRWA